MSIFCINSPHQAEAIGPILLIALGISSYALLDATYDQAEATGPSLLIALGIWRLPAMTMLHVVLVVGLSRGRIIKDDQ